MEDFIKKSMTVKADIENIPKLTEFVEESLIELGCSPKAMIQFSVAVDELVSNVCYYAYGDGKKGDVTVEVGEEDNDEAIFLKFLDDGVPYNPLEKEDPDVTLSLEEREVGGLGIFMVKKTMDDIEYEYNAGQNVVVIKKRK